MTQQVVPVCRFCCPSEAPLYSSLMGVFSLLSLVRKISGKGIRSKCSRLAPVTQEYWCPDEWMLVVQQHSHLLLSRSISGRSSRFWKFLAPFSGQLVYAWNPLPVLTSGGFVQPILFSKLERLRCCHSLQLQDLILTL